MVQKRERLVIERRKLERVAEEQFAVEKKRRLDRLGDLEREKLLIPGKIGQGGGDRERDSRPVFGQGDFGRKKFFTESDRVDREREGFFNREQRDGRPRDVSFMSDDRRSSREERSDEYYRGGKPRDSILKGEDRRSSRDDDDRRDRSFREEGHECDDRKGRSSREDRDPPSDRSHRGNADSTPLGLV